MRRRSGRGAAAHQPSFNEATMTSRKLRLDLEDLSVESFVPEPADTRRGTVQGAQQTGNCGTLDGPGCNVTQAPSFCASPESCDWTRCVNLSCIDNCTAGTCPSEPPTDPTHTMQPVTCTIRLCPIDPE
jgi:hypothetical protein